MDIHETAKPSCELRKARGIEAHCQGETCTYWRVVDHLGVPVPAKHGCAVQYFQMLDGGDEVASWLLSVKQRMEGAGELGVAAAG